MNANVLKTFVPAVLVGASALMGCAHDHPAMESASASGVTQTTSSQMQSAPRTNNTMGLSSDLIAACKIDFGNVATAPKFGFDESVVAPDERSVLDQVAKCVTVGPLKGRSLQLVGRADPRGEEEYNMVLGSSRAQTVRAYLLADGVAASTVTTTSRGKLDATGTDESGWQTDRRVDIDLK